MYSLRMIHGFAPIGLAFLESGEGKKAIISLLVDGIIDFIHGHCLESYHPELVDG